MSTSKILRKKSNKGLKVRPPGIIAPYKPIPDICQSELARSFKEGIIFNITGPTDMWSCLN